MPVSSEKQGPALARSPWWFIPTLYFQQGLPVMVVQQLSVILYKRMGVSNDQIALWTSLIAWPWILKLLWAPLIDLNGKKRTWVLTSQLLMTLALAGAALATGSPSFLSVSLAIFFGIAFLSATHDIALDGYYLLALEPSSQAFFMGISNTSFRLAMIFCTGVLVMLAGYGESSGLSIAEAWRNVLLLAAGVFGVLMLYAHWAMPVAKNDQPVRRNQENASSRASFLDAIRTFFAQDQILVILCFILTYRFGESMLSKMSSLFLLDQPEAGGLGLTTMQVGMIAGNVGMISLVLGGLLGGFVISKFGLKKCVWPMAVFMHLPNLAYLWASQSHPSLSAIYGITIVDQFAYGFGLSSFMVYLMYLCQKSQYSTTHYAIVMGLMSLGASLAGISSGILQKNFGYFGFFCAVCLATLPGMIFLARVPMNFQDHEKNLKQKFDSGKKEPDSDWGTEASTGAY